MEIDREGGPLREKIIEEGHQLASSGDKLLAQLASMIENHPDDAGLREMWETLVEKNKELLDLLSRA